MAYQNTTQSTRGQVMDYVVDMASVFTVAYGLYVSRDVLSGVQEGRF